jgi:hypothetical protein
MGGTGIEVRMRILRQAAAQEIIKPFRTHGWDADVFSENLDGEYLVMRATKSDVERKVALMYSSATSNTHYKVLDASVDHIFTNGALYHIERYAYGIATPVEPVGEFFPLLVAWNKELAPAMLPAAPETLPRAIRHITGESPLDGVWARLNQFASVQLAEKLVRRRATDERVALSEEVVKAKAAGVAFAIRNAADYFRAIPHDSLNKRILNLYYGALALAFSELLASPRGPADLDEVEGMTKQGHGLYTVPSQTADFGGLNVGVLATGFFPRWVSFLGEDTSLFPRSKPKTASDLEKLAPRMATTLCELLAAIPEISDLFSEVFDIPPSWLVPVVDREANPGLFGRGAAPQGATYVKLIDSSGLITRDRIETAGLPIAEITLLTEPADERGFRVRVDHVGHTYWHGVVPIHRSPFEQRGALILPVVSGASQYRAIAMVVLYALSILVRYMPSAWRRVEGGDWDHHLALIKTTLGVFERLLPQQFLESILNESVYARQPGSLI